MPLNVRRFFASFSLIFSGLIFAGAQTAAPTASPNPNNTNANPPANAAPAPTSGEIMRARISKAKAFIVVRNYNAAIYELENIRRETNDASVNGVVNVLLMNTYLEQGDYKRAQDFLGEFYKAQTSKKPNAAAQYLTVAAQVVKGARNQAERYRALGLTISDRNLPLEAAVDVQKMRDTLETVIEQSKNIGQDKNQTAGAMALLEEATTTRAVLAKDDYDAKHWKDAVGDAREEMTSSRSVIINAAGDAPPEISAVVSTTPTVAANLPNNSQSAGTLIKNTEPAPLFKPVTNENLPVTVKNNVSQTNPPIDLNAKTVSDAPVGGEPAKTNSSNISPVNNSETAQNNSTRVRTVAGATDDNAGTDNREKKNTVDPAVKNDSPLNVDSLISYATKKTSPSYPAVAKSMRTTGVVTIKVLVDEAGEVSAIEKTDGPAALQSAAKDAIKKWKFKPFVRDGQPVKATGFVSFNFAL